jgi:hypothetical protein
MAMIKVFLKNNKIIKFELGDEKKEMQLVSRFHNGLDGNAVLKLKTSSNKDEYTRVRVSDILNMQCLKDELNKTTQDSKFKTREEYEQWKEKKTRENILKSSTDDFGIPFYPGAKTDADTQAVCTAPEIGIIAEREEQSGLKKLKHCYRTHDPFGTVVKFYKKQKGLKGGIVVDDEGHKSASFCLSKTGECNEVSVGTSVAISSPWFVPTKMKMNHDLLIVITHRVKK